MNALASMALERTLVFKCNRRIHSSSNMLNFIETE
jgi:hypothetical protein